MREEKRDQSDGLKLNLDWQKVERILSRGNDVVIKRKKRDGKLVTIVYAQSLKIVEIVVDTPHG